MPTTIISITYPRGYIVEPEFSLFPTDTSFPDDNFYPNEPV